MIAAIAGVVLLIVLLAVGNALTQLCATTALCQWRYPR
jgi:hypothetical protein